MIRTFFGSPGCGKTTLAVKLLKKRSKIYNHTYANFEHLVPGSAVADLNGLGLWTFPEDSYLVVDEAGIEYNSRKTKSFPQHTIAWYKKHRHYMCDIDIFSQSWEDMDITIRRLTDQLWYMYHIGPFTLCRRVYKRVTINKDTEQIIDGYRMPCMLWLFAFPLQLLHITQKRFMLTYRPKYYKYFDSWSKDDIPKKDFPVNPVEE